MNSDNNSHSHLYLSNFNVSTMSGSFFNIRQNILIPQSTFHPVKTISDVNGSVAIVRSEMQTGSDVYSLEPCYLNLTPLTAKYQVSQVIQNPEINSSSDEMISLGYKFVTNDVNGCPSAGKDLSNMLYMEEVPSISSTSHFISPISLHDTLPSSNTVKAEPRSGNNVNPENEVSKILLNTKKELIDSIDSNRSRDDPLSSSREEVFSAPRPSHCAPPVFRDILQPSKTASVGSRTFNPQYKVCKVAADKKKEFPKIMDSVQSKDGSFSCNKCHLIFVSAEDLETHNSLSNEILGIPYSCYLCSFLSERSSTVELHLAFEHNQKYSYSCVYCSHITGSRNDMKRHIHSEHLLIKTKTFICSRNPQPLKNYSPVHNINNNNSLLLSSETSRLANNIKSIETNHTNQTESIEPNQLKQIRAMPTQTLLKNNTSKELVNNTKEVQRDLKNIITKNFVDKFTNIDQIISIGNCKTKIKDINRSNVKACSRIVKKPIHVIKKPAFVCFHCGYNSRTKLCIKIHIKNKHFNYENKPKVTAVSLKKACKISKPVFESCQRTRLARLCKKTNSAG